MQKRFGLIGRKLGHSYSPQIHNMLGDYPYDLIELEPEQVEDFVRNGDYAGFNVTIPYKVVVAGLCDELSEQAKTLGCVNCVVRLEDGTIYGDNTDYYGFSYLVDQAGIDVRWQKAVVLGAGGASRTVQAVLRDKGASEVVVLSRGLEGSTLNDLDKHSDATVLVNATPVGMYPACPDSPVDIEPLCAAGETKQGYKDGLAGVVDVVYNPSRTGLMLQAEKYGVPHTSGLGMLVAQAKRASELFQGIAIDDSVISAITNAIRFETGNIVLIGMPGSGKSTVGKALAERLGREFVDIDELIEKRAGVDIPTIFETEGEAGFRSHETKVVDSVGGLSGKVISCGGGVVTVPRNYDLLHQNGTIVLLKRELDSLETEGRPLSASEGVFALKKKRNRLYNAWADVVVENDADLETVVERVLSAIAPQETIREVLSVGKKKILVMNGPNINLLGVREPDIYGRQDFKALENLVKQTADDEGLYAELYQSNHEGDLVDAIQAARGQFDGIVINPGAYTHTSVALLDAFKAVQIPFVEVHISDVASREDFRQVSYVRQAALKTISGQGIDGYRQAMLFLKESLA